MDCSTALIALGVGFLVFQSASRDAGASRTVGRLIGVVIILGAICAMLCSMKMCLGGKCPWGKGAAMCPISKDKLATNT